MNNLRRHLTLAANQLGLRAETEHAITLPDGRELRAEAFFPDLGGPKGIAVFCLDGVPTVTIEAVLGAGHAASFLGEPAGDEVLEIDGYARMFAEWGWAGNPARRPPWMDVGSRPSNVAH